MQRTLAWLLPTRHHRVWATLLALMGVVACFVPLFDIVGYESAALFGVVGGLAALTSSLRSYAPDLWPPPLEGDVSPLVRWWAATSRILAYLLVPALLLALNALRVRNCDPAAGVAFWLVIPVCSVGIGAAVGTTIASVVPRSAWSQRLLAALWAAGTVVDFGLRLALEPPIVGFHAFLGYFSGSIYDEALAVPDGLLAYRAIQVVGLAAVLACLQWRWSKRRSEEGAKHVTPRAWMVAAVVLGLLWAGAFAERDRWGIDLTAEEVAERLGGRVESEHFVILYPETERFDSEEVARMVEDHEFRYAEMKAFFGTDPVDLHGEKVLSYVYADRPQKGRLIGARRTLVAKIWLGEMHILWRHYGDHMLAHELAHVFTEPFSSGPLRLSTRFGVGINMGLVEGAATAADWHSAELTPHESSAALQRLDRAPDLRRLVGASGFWTQSSGRAYTLVGSFIRYLVETRGIEKFRRAYPNGAFAEVYGESVDALVTEWEKYLAAIPLSEADMELARFLYDRPTIFEKTCARTIGELRFEGKSAARSGKIGELRSRYARVMEYAPRNTRYRLEYAELLAGLGELDEASSVVSALLEENELTAAETAQILHLLGDVAWRAGRVDAARETYASALASGLPNDFERLLEAKLLALEGPLRARTFALEYLVTSSGAPHALYYPTAWRAHFPQDALAAYLVGRRLWSVAEWAEALPHLEFALEELESTTLRRETRRMLGQVHYGLEKWGDARAQFEVLRDVPRATYSVEAEEWLDRIEWRERNRVEGRGR